ncbi:MAG: molecular chaperone HtpG [Ectothiorhodospiraceae bacterium AqS1]|nr:molecular chaperone HtpG [Ectothiorhodospiraceae bacterium AqS1]
MSENTNRETFGFQAEIRRLLELMIRSLYGNKEIFLREMISNAADAADKLRFEALSDSDLYEGDGDIKVRILIDPKARTITIKDNGIGMSKEEIVENLGTIARSGTRDFLASLTGDSSKDTQLIGQFGVGFYSGFIVADRITVSSRRAGLPASQGVRWRSNGEGEFTVETIEIRDRGTEVTLHLREDEDEFLEAHRIKGIVRKYSDHISIPISMPGSDDDDDDDAQEEETINQATALWARNKNEIDDDDYKNFYRHIAHDFEDPLTWLHHRVEGNLEYNLLLYIPSRAPFDLMDRSIKRGVRLYIRRVFVMEDAEQLMPAYLRFIRGVIDSADLPLNVSRELLQEDRQIRSIRAGAVKRVLDLLASMAKNEGEKYESFQREFGRILKEGIVEDEKNRTTIAGLLRFASTEQSTNATPCVSLDDYIERMKEGQKGIYYITASGYRAARNSPHLEAFDKHGIEVLLLTDPIDEWVVMHLAQYKEKPLISVMKGEFDLDDIASSKEDEDSKAAEKDAAEATSDANADAEEYEKLLLYLRNALEDRVRDVRITRRLDSSPACLVREENEISHQMERLLDAAGQSIHNIRPTLEINPAHPLIKRLAVQVEGELSHDWGILIFEQSLLSEGGSLEDPAAFVRRMNQLLLVPVKAIDAPRRRKARISEKGKSRADATSAKASAKASAKTRAKPKKIAGGAARGSKARKEDS